MNETGESLVLRRKTYDINYIRPCMTDKKKRMAEAILNNLKIEPKKMYDLLKKSKMFDKLTFSKDIGVVRADIGKGNVTIFNTGQLTFRNIDDDKKVVEIVKKLDKILRVGF